MNLYQQDSESILRTLIYYTVGFTLPSAATFGTPTPITIAENDPEERDTQVLVSMPNEDGSEGEDTLTLTYARYDLSTLVPANSNVITMQDVPFSTYDILTQINTVYALGLTQDDVQDVMYVNAEGPFNLIAKPGSLAWKNQLALTVVIVDAPSPTPAPSPSPSPSPTPS